MTAAGSSMTINGISSARIIARAAASSASGGLAPARSWRQADGFHAVQQRGDSIAVGVSALSPHAVERRQDHAAHPGDRPAIPQRPGTRDGAGQMLPRRTHRGSGHIGTGSHLSTVLLSPAIINVAPSPTG